MKLKFSKVDRQFNPKFLALAGIYACAFLTNRNDELRSMSVGDVTPTNRAPASCGVIQ
jgi:hypothetical protein